MTNSDDARSKNGYPLTSRATVTRRLTSDPSFIREAVLLLQSRFERRGLLPPPAGWMISHTSRGTDLATRVAAGTVDDRELLDAVAWLAVYARQIASVLREQEIDASPDLAARAALYGVRAASRPVPPPMTAAERSERSFSRPDTREAPVLPEPLPEPAETQEEAVVVAARPVAAEPVVAGDERPLPSGLAATVLGLLEANPGGLRLDAIVRQLGPAATVTPALSSLVDGGWISRTGAGRWASYKVV